MPSSTFSKTIATGVRQSAGFRRRIGYAARMKRLADKLAASLRERKRLRSRVPLSIAIADRFAQLSVEAWRAATAGGSLFHSAEYQRAFERARPPNIEPRYALISDGDTPVAAVCIQIVTLDLTQLGDVQRRRALRKLGRRMRQRVLVCGNLLAFGLHGVHIAAGADRELAWQAVSEVVYRVRRAEKLAGKMAFVIMKDFDAAAKRDSAVLAKLSYGAVETEPNMVLAVDPTWRTHEDYLKSLASKFRSDIKSRVIKRCDDAGISVERLTEVAVEADTLQQLYLQVHGNATLRPFTLPADYWQVLLAMAGDGAALHVARLAGRVVGFIVTVKDGDTAFVYHVGFDRAVAAAGAPIYLRLLHASLAQAIEFGCRRVSFGRTALEPKARLGCVPEDTFVWVRHRHPLLNQLLQPLLRLIEHEEAPQMTPFKAPQN